MDLIIRNARLSTRPEDGLFDVGVENGRIAAIAPKLSAEGREHAAAGGLVCAGLIETHIHLDKSRIIERCPPEEAREVNPVKSVAPMKKTWTVEDVHARAARTLEECILHGATRMRTQVEVDPGIGMRGFEAVSALIDKYKWAIDLEICVFPQEGLTNYPGTDELVVEGLKRGAKVVGGAPRYDTDGPAQIERIFALGREFDVDIDIHLDVGPTADHLFVHQVCDLTEKYRRGGRVVAGHMAKLSTMPPERLKEVARRLADVGVAVTVLPATDLYLMGRDQDHNVRRGVAETSSIGYWIGEKFARQGYMTEGLGLALKFAFERLRLHRVEAACLPHNVPSRGVLMKAGFREEGYAREYLCIDGKWQDHVLFGILASEWQPRTV